MHAVTSSPMVMQNAASSHCLMLLVYQDSMNTVYATIFTVLCVASCFGFTDHHQVIYIYNCMAIIEHTLDPLFLVSLNVAVLILVSF
jgi:hypothetical protein